MQNVMPSGSERNAVSWTSLIVGLAVNGFGEEALELFREMEGQGLVPSEITFVLFFYDVQLLCCISFTFWRVREKRGIQCNFCQIEGGHVYYL